MSVVLDLGNMNKNNIYTKAIIGKEVERGEGYTIFLYIIEFEDLKRCDD